jgi:hypothetical protein
MLRLLQRSLFVLICAASSLIFPSLLNAAQDPVLVMLGIGLQPSVGFGSRSVAKRQLICIIIVSTLTEEFVADPQMISANRRNISSSFIRTILTQIPCKDRIRATGLQIIYAIFRDPLVLTDLSIEAPLVRLCCTFKANVESRGTRGRAPLSRGAGQGAAARCDRVRETAARGRQQRLCRSRWRSGGTTGCCGLSSSPTTRARRIGPRRKLPEALVAAADFPCKGQIDLADQILLGFASISRDSRYGQNARAFGQAG